MTLASRVWPLGKIPKPQISIAMKFGNRLGSARKLALLVLAILTAQASASSINIIAANSGAWVYDPNYGVPGDGIVNGSPSAVGFSGLISASQEPTIVIGPNGASIGTGTVSLLGGIGPAASGRGIALAQSDGTFTVHEDTTYSLSGSLSGISAGGNSVDQFVRFYDLTAKAMMFTTNNTSREIDFSLLINETGMLTAGHTYWWVFEESIWFGDTISATGGTTLTIGDGGGASVPEGGATLALLSVGLGGVGFLRRMLAV